MQPSEYTRLYELEETLWWFRGMERISTALLERARADAGRSVRVLDAGCGTGGMLGPLSRFGPVTGVDLFPAAVALASSRRAAPVVRGSVAALPFRAESFGLVTSFDVIYHLDVSDDVAALAEMARVLEPGGTLLLRVPAYDRMRSHHDEAVHTRQRYEKKELVSKLERAGLEPVLVTFANCLLFPLAWLRRSAEKLRPPKGEESEVRAVSPALNALFENVLGLEARLLRRTSLPFGLSLMALARKGGSR